VEEFQLCDQAEFWPAYPDILMRSFFPWFKIMGKEECKREWGENYCPESSLFCNDFTMANKRD